MDVQAERPRSVAGPRHHVHLIPNARLEHRVCIVVQARIHAASHADEVDDLVPKPASALDRREESTVPEVAGVVVTQHHAEHLVVLDRPEQRRRRALVIRCHHVIVALVRICLVHGDLLTLDECECRRQLVREVDRRGHCAQRALVFAIPLTGQCDEDHENGLARTGCGNDGAATGALLAFLFRLAERLLLEVSQLDLSRRNPCDADRRRKAIPGQLNCRLHTHLLPQKVLVQHQTDLAIVLEDCKVAPVLDRLHVVARRHPVEPDQTAGTLGQGEERRPVRNVLFDIDRCV